MRLFFLSFYWCDWWLGPAADHILSLLLSMTPSNIHTHTPTPSFPQKWPAISPLCHLLVSPISYSLSRSSSKMSTSSLPVVERLLFLLMLSFASVMAKRSPLLHSIGSSRMAADEKGKEGREGISLSSSVRTGDGLYGNNHSNGEPVQTGLMPFLLLHLQ